MRLLRRKSYLLLFWVIVVAGGFAAHFSSLFPNVVRGDAELPVQRACTFGEFLGSTVFYLAILSAMTFHVVTTERSRRANSTKVHSESETESSSRNSANSTNVRSESETETTSHSRSQEA